MMTPTQATLARAIAASGHPWATPGIACCDPLRGIVWRMTENETNTWVPPDGYAIPGYWLPVAPGDGSTQPKVDSIRRALATGPDLSDDAVHLLLPQIARALVVRDGELVNLVDVLTAVCREAMRCPNTDWPSIIAHVWLRVHGCEVPNG